MPEKRRDRRRKLSPKFVAVVMPDPGRDRVEWYDATPSAPRGFAIRVSVRGAAQEPVRTWVLTYRVNGRKRWLSLGSANSIALADARELGHTALRRVEKGEDPAAERERLRESDSFAGLVGEYIEHGAAGRSDRTNENYRRQKRALAATPLGKMSAPGVVRADIRAHVEKLAATAPVQAVRTLRLDPRGVPLGDRPRSTPGRPHGRAHGSRDEGPRAAPAR